MKTNYKTLLWALGLLYTFFLGHPFTTIAQTDSSGTQASQYGHGTNWYADLPIDQTDAPQIAWRQTVGQGRSQIIGENNELIVTSGSAEKQTDGSFQLNSKVLSINASNGEINWLYESGSKMYDSQETFGGELACPQATPATTERNVFTVDFSGHLTCLDRKTGKLSWEKDLVSEFGAEPVQYGFSSSPVIDPNEPDTLIVMAAGKQGGLLALRSGDGSLRWRAECETASYATPVFAQLGGVSQWIVVSENEVIGIATDKGKRLWRLPLAQPGLTNVPTPLVIDQSRIVIAGQGCEGTRCVEIKKQGTRWTTREIWHSRRLQFFYTNWAKLNDDVLISCNEKFLTAVNLEDGNILGRWRGFGDGNLMIVPGGIWVLSGKGRLNRLRYQPEDQQIFHEAEYSILDARCWTPISVIGDRMLVRGGGQLICINFDKDSNRLLKNQLSEPARLALKQKPKTKVSSLVNEILGIFQNQGQDAALKRYQQLRSQNRLGEDSRIELATVAAEQNMPDLVKMILSHAKEDFPDSAKIDSAISELTDKR